MKQVVSNPQVDNNSISFIYSQKKDKQIKRSKYNISNGELMEETPYFNNDEIASFCPGYQFPIGNNEFVTTLIEDDYYLVKYKLLK